MQHFSGAVKNSDQFGCKTVSCSNFQPRQDIFNSLFSSCFVKEVWLPFAWHASFVAFKLQCFPQADSSHPQVRCQSLFITVRVTRFTCLYACLKLLSRLQWLDRMTSIQSNLVIINSKKQSLSASAGVRLYKALGPTKTKLKWFGEWVFLEPGSL